MSSQVGDRFLFTCLLDDDDDVLHHLADVIIFIIIMQRLCFQLLIQCFELPSVL